MWFIHMESGHVMYRKITHKYANQYAFEYGNCETLTLSLSHVMRCFVQIVPEIIFGIILFKIGSNNTLIYVFSVTVYTLSFINFLSNVCCFSENSSILATIDSRNTRWTPMGFSICKEVRRNVNDSVNGTDYKLKYMIRQIQQRKVKFSKKHELKEYRFFVWPIYSCEIPIDVFFIIISVAFVSCSTEISATWCT